MILMVVDKCFAERGEAKKKQRGKWDEKHKSSSSVHLLYCLFVISFMEYYGPYNDAYYIYEALVYFLNWSKMFINHNNNNNNLI